MATLEELMKYGERVAEAPSEEQAFEALPKYAQDRLVPADAEQIEVLKVSTGDRAPRVVIHRPWRASR